MTPPHPDTPTKRCPHGWEFHLNDIPFPTVVSEVRDIILGSTPYLKGCYNVFFFISYFQRETGFASTVQMYRYRQQLFSRALLSELFCLDG